jgi:hypothetical protein
MPPASLRPIDRVDRISPREFEMEYARPGRPVILAGAIRDWPAFKRWTPDYLRQACGGKRVHVTTVPSSYDGGLWNEADEDAYRGKEMSVADYVTLIQKVDPDRAHFLPQQDMAADFPELLKDIPLSEYFSPGRLHSVNLWIGPVARIAPPPLHYDEHNNFGAHVIGRKRWVLAAPSQSSNVYPWPFFSFHPHASKVNVHRPDLARFPRFRDVELREAVAEPGDILFIPALWWHIPHYIEMSVMINIWWRPSLDRIFAPRGLKLRVNRGALKATGQMLQAVKGRLAR